MSAINQSDSEIVFSSQDLDNSTPALQSLKITHQSPLSKFNMAHKNRYYEGNPSCNVTSSFAEPPSSGKKISRKTSDDSMSDIQARRADQLQKYNCEGFVRSASKHDGYSSEEKRKDRVKKEIQNLENLLNDIQLKDSIDQKIENMRGKISSVGGNFDSAVKLGRGIHEKYQCIKQLAAGGDFIKLAYKSNQQGKRFVFYSETIEAICYRDPKSKVPKTKQMIYLSEITNINENFRTSQAFKKYSNAKIDEDCFFAIETKDRTLDLIAPNLETKKIWVKTLNLLTLMAKNRIKESSSGSSIDVTQAVDKEYEVVAKQFAGNLGNIQNEIDEIKQLCYSNEKKLKKNFLDLAEEAIMREAEQAYRLSKAVRVLDHELQEARDENQGLKSECQGLKVENISVKKNLEATSLQRRQLVAQMRSYNDEKRSIVDFIKQFQKKLLNCVEFLSLLDFEVQEKDGEQLVSTNNISEGTFLSEDFSNLEVFMNQMQVQFDTIMLRTSQMQRKFSDLQDRLKENATIYETTNKDNEILANKYNEIYALYNEAVLEKEKLSSEVNNFNGQLDHNIKENMKLKKEISELEVQLNEVKRTSIAKDNDLQNMIEHAKKLQNNMETQFEELRKESKESEMNKLNILEDRYNMQIRRYENKILENERMINELSELVKSYETQMDDYVKDIDDKQNYIDDLAASRCKLNNMIVEMENNLNSRNLNQNQNQNIKTPVRRSTADTYSHCEDRSTIESPDHEEMTQEKKRLDTQQQISLALDEKEKLHSEKLAAMEANLKHHMDEIVRLEEENKQYHVRVASTKDHEDYLKQKITRYQYKMKDVMQEGAKVKKQFNKLELYLSHWLNLIYLENMISCVDDSDPISFTVFSKEVNQGILAQAAEKVRRAFDGIQTHSEFLKDVLKHVENSIPNITFDIKSVELARAYRHKVREAKSHQSRKVSGDLSTTIGSHRIQSKTSSLSVLSPLMNEAKHSEKVEREPFRQISSPFSKKIDDLVNRETMIHKEKQKVRPKVQINNENCPQRTVKVTSQGLIKAKRPGY